MEKYLLSEIIYALILQIIMKLVILFTVQRTLSLTLNAVKDRERKDRHQLQNRRQI